LIDVERRAGCDVADFWEPMHSRKERNLILDPGEFYILASKEAVQVLPDYSAEMVPFSIRWWASFACTMPALRLRGRRRARRARGAGGAARAKCRSSSSTEEPKQFVA
jgi:2'-deoxycytidine 5'-triphosphate deaminase DCD